MIGEILTQCLNNPQLSLSMDGYIQLKPTKKKVTKKYHSATLYANFNTVECNRLS